MVELREELRTAEYELRTRPTVDDVDCLRQAGAPAQRVHVGSHTQGVFDTAPVLPVHVVASA